MIRTELRRNWLLLGRRRASLVGCGIGCVVESGFFKIVVPWLGGGHYWERPPFLHLF